jgi:class 3 adenylate cyclase
MPIPAPPTPARPPEVRIADSDREHAIELLKQACAEGRLTLDEFSERAGAIYAARTGTDLEQVMTDLPQPYAPASYAPAQPPARRSEPARWTIGIMGGGKRRGRYRLRGTTNAVAFWGGCDLDLRHAEVEGPEIVINAVSIMGGIDITVPEGIPVELSGIAIMGSKDLKGKDVPMLPGSPLVRVRAFALMGGVTIKTKPVNPDYRPGKRRRTAELLVDPPFQEALTTGDTSEPTPLVDGDLIDVAARGELPLHKLRELPEGTITVMFADVSGPIDAAPRAEILRTEVRACGGRTIASQSQASMVAFTGAGRALRCAIGIQDAFAKYNTESPGSAVAARIGLHASEISQSSDDFVGGAVIVAAGITKQAKGGQILASSVLKELCDLSGEFEFGEGQEMTLGGLSTPRRVYPVAWSSRP